MRAYPEAGRRVVVLVHGLMCTESVWGEPGEDYGALLDRDLGTTAVYVRYNSGRAIADNGEALAALLEALALAWPVPLEEIVPIGFSMGGLVLRSACHVASTATAPSRWLPLVRRAVYVGTPHLGAPLERAGRLVTRVLDAIQDPYTQLVASLAELRSEGIKDLGDADLRREDRSRRLGLSDREHPVPLLPNIRHCLLAGTVSDDPTLAALFGDTIVPVRSGTGVGAAPTLARVKVFPRVTHLGLAAHPDVYDEIRAFCAEEVTA
jgi:pimeloyl-ACP methyl ester carboxylesterase